MYMSTSIIPNITNQSIKNYNNMYRLFCSDLNINNPYETFISLCYKISQRTNKCISNETIKQILCAINYKLKKNNSSADLIKEYSLLITHMRKICAYQTQNPCINNNIPEWDYLIHKRKYWKHSNEINSDIYYVISSLYTLIPPRRLIDYVNMFIYLEQINPILLKNINDKKNYLCITDNGTYFIFNNYKTNKSYGSQIFKLPDKLSIILKNYIYTRNLLHGDNLFNLNTTNNYGRTKFYNLLNTTFNCSVDNIRHSYISNLFSNNIPSSYELNSISNFMAHSIATHINYRKNKPTKINNIYIPNYINPYSKQGQLLLHNSNIYRTLFNIIKSYIILMLFTIYKI